MLAWALWILGWLLLAYASCVVATLQAHWPFPEPEHRGYARECFWMAIGSFSIALVLIARSEEMAEFLLRVLDAWRDLLGWEWR